jgi:hypothetical protein
MSAVGYESATGKPGFNRGSLHYAPPDFLWNLVAPVNIMRLSSRKGAHVVLSSAAWQEIPGSPDFLWNLVTLANFMRLLLLKGSPETSSSAAWQEIRVGKWLKCALYAR